MPNNLEISEKVFQQDLIKKLNLTETEILKWGPTIKLMYQQEMICPTLPLNQCCVGYVHQKLVRSPEGEIHVQSYYCPKKQFLNNYLLRQFADEYLSISLYDKDIICNCLEEKTLLVKLRERIENNENLGVYLYGNCGIGKTYKIIGYCNDMNKQNNCTIAYTFLPQLYSKLCDNFTQKLSNDKIIKNCQTVDILVLDDLGAEYAKSWFYHSFLLPTINYRCEAKKPIIVVSNHSFENLKKNYEKRNWTTNTAHCNPTEQKVITERLFDRLKQTLKVRATYSGESRRR